MSIEMCKWKKTRKKKFTVYLHLPYFLCLFLKRIHFFRTPLFFVTRHMTSAISRNNAMAIDRIITDKTSLSVN